MFGDLETLRRDERPNPPLLRAGDGITALVWFHRHRLKTTLPGVEELRGTEPSDEALRIQYHEQVHCYQTGPGTASASRPRSSFEMYPTRLSLSASLVERPWAGSGTPGGVPQDGFCVASARRSTKRRKGGE